MSDPALYLSLTTDANTIALIPIAKGALDDKAVSDRDQKWMKSTGFDASVGSICLCADNSGNLTHAYYGLGEASPKVSDIWWLAAAAAALPAGDYSLQGDFDPAMVKAAALGWCLSQYSFDHYKSDDDQDKKTRRLILDSGEVIESISDSYQAIALVRDLVNTPTEDMGPSELEAVVEEIAITFMGKCDTIIGDDLLAADFPAIHAVGRAASQTNAPRLIDLRWGDEDAPKLTLVGKGVCFDTGGLDLKPSQFMRNMKKDMGGAAHVLGLACMIMAADLNVNLRVLIPAVENAVAGNSFRPGDILETRKGLTVEVGNTDAEGRLVLCDALTLACEEKPDLLIDMATLTGAARVALGPDLPATFTNDEDLWSALDKAQATTGDPIWRMPLWAGYDEDLNSPIADLCNVTDGGFAGAITAGLYLQRFVDSDIRWIHVDVFAWNPKARAGRPKGGEAQGIRTLFETITNTL